MQMMVCLAFAILRDYILYTCCFIVQFIHATYIFDCVYINYIDLVNSFNFFVVSPISCEN